MYSIKWRIVRSILALNILVPSFIAGSFAEFIVKKHPEKGIFLLLCGAILLFAGLVLLRRMSRRPASQKLFVESQTEHTDMAVAYMIIYIFPAVHPHPMLAVFLLSLVGIFIEVGADPFPANPMFKILGWHLVSADVNTSSGKKKKVVLIVPLSQEELDGTTNSVAIGGGVYIVTR